MGACLSAPVTAKSSRNLKESQMRNLGALYAHDAELLQAVAGVQLVRHECAKLVTTSDTFFKALGASSKATSVFGEQLEKLADKHLGGSLATLPEESHTQDLSEVLRVDKLVKELGAKEISTSELQTNEFSVKVAPALHALRDTMEREFKVQVEPCIDAHEAAYNVARGPRVRLEQMSKLPDEKKAIDANERSIASLEVEVAQQKAQLSTTSEHLKTKVLAFLRKNTPKLNDAVCAFALAQHDAYIAMAASISEATVVQQRGSLATMRQQSDRFLEASQQLPRQVTPSPHPPQDAVAEVQAEAA